jgi:hypothetical protein
MRTLALHLALLWMGLSGCGCFHLTPGSGRKMVPETVSAAQAQLFDELVGDVETLAGEIGPREQMGTPDRLKEAQRWIQSQLRVVGIEPELQEYDCAGVTVANIIATFRGTARPEEIVIVGAHYDSVPGSPGANDNASGVAVLLAMARRLPETAPQRTIRLVFFVNEERPWGGTERMGSRVHARSCRSRGENVVAMISLDLLGYYSERPGSQHYPPIVRWMLPSTADFLGFVSDRANQPLLDRVVRSFRTHASLSSIGVAIDQRDVGRSDHSSFWIEGYPAILITDTANFRDDAYHTPRDTPDRLDYRRLSLAAEGILGVVRDLAGIEPRAKQAAD